MTQIPQREIGTGHNGQEAHGYAEGDITGLNPQVAKTNLNDFTSGMFYAQDALYDVLLEMMENLETNWSSPKAVEFGNKYIPLLNDTLNNIMECAYEVRRNAVGAFNRIASSNGLQPIYDDIERPNGMFFTNIMFKEVNANGVVGMNFENVKNSIIPTLWSGTKEALNKFDEVPMSIAFYDPDGSMVAAYSDSIKRCKRDVLNDVAELVRELIANIEDETKTVEAAKNQATEALSTNA